MRKHSIISFFFALIVILLLSACSDWFSVSKVGCELDPCADVEHSTGVCEDDWLVYGSYSCGCEENYFWNWHSNSSCVNPCDSKPCGITHSTGECTPLDYDEYECGCEKGWFWDGFKCVDPCEGVSCDVPDSTGKCIGEDWNKYSCECEKKVWDHSSGRCITVCENNPCDAIPHANGCVPKNDTEYYCSCEYDYYWNGEECLSY